jgi:BirA family biotin operon repressor/biotin-[acetyl-CoA-carboxylase] ligase
MSVRLPPGYGLAAFDAIDSTNEEARRRGDAGERGPLWIWARRQSAGRGRRGRSWTSLEGNLFATLLLTPDRPPAEAARLSFAAALSVHDMATDLCPQAQVRLKWPNDVLLGGAKCAGILLEAASGHALSGWLAVGIGVNLAHAPENAAYPATALALHGRLATAEEALESLALAWERWHARWREEGFAPLRRAWLARAAGLGQPVIARLASETCEGVFEGLDEDGAMTLRLPDGRLRAISSGEVFLREV